MTKKMEIWPTQVSHVGNIKFEVFQQLGLLVQNPCLGKCTCKLALGYYLRISLIRVLELVLWFLRATCLCCLGFAVDTVSGPPMTVVTEWIQSCCKSTGMFLLVTLTWSKRSLVSSTWTCSFWSQLLSSLLWSGQQF